MSSADTPATPDYTGAANATASGNLDVARATAAANRPNYYTPYGSQTATQSSDNPDQWTITQMLSPDQQALFDQNERIVGTFGNLAEQGLGQVGQSVANGINWNGLPQASVNAGQTAMDAILARVNPQLASDAAATEARLAEQGIQIGSKAYDSAMGGLARQRNDAYSQAALQGINVGNQARAQALNEQLTGQSNTVNLLNALRTGSQVSVPSLMPVGTQANVGGADYNSAAANSYNAAVANSNVTNAQNNANTQSGLQLANMLYNWY